ncbi:MAG: hypothetical protein ACFFF9_07295 [Candidatus Thorarchaeota archaeon]
MKERIKITDSKVECPVKDCNIRVDRQRGRFKRKDEFLCRKHNIYISPSTFDHLAWLDNFLWMDSSGRKLFNRIEEYKREKHRLGRERSEDALTWNVFRFLERSNLIEGFLGSIADTSLQSAEVIYWSYSQREDSGWSLLERAGDEFGERKRGGSEPDIIVRTENALFFIEAKFTAPNKKPPRNIPDSMKYATRANNWFSEVFDSDFTTVAVDKAYFELTRFWVLGTWIAERYDLDFYLINLVLSERETDIEASFRRHIKENQRWKFIRTTWETIYQYISQQSPSNDKDVMIRYFRNKTRGYDRIGRLIPAFSIQ